MVIVQPYTAAPDGWWDDDRAYSNAHFIVQTHRLALSKIRLSLSHTIRGMRSEQCAQDDYRIIRRLPPHYVIASARTKMEVLSFFLSFIIISLRVISFAHPNISLPSNRSKVVDDWRLLDSVQFWEFMDLLHTALGNWETTEHGDFAFKERLRVARRCLIGPL
eukprot:NODE_5318_length_691_cov_30.574766_g4944_i0.p1 GENE.NODE_5318_length_691_cov_30.574766_g4944_i0~~NODE_5318_length_691_cov_30.574766_g4944_i0.p1  ORF type:complete len:163 (-),score=8.29 NODE_5318_length_691_cov_30.574766_g4944_i0:67-555(-)